MHDENQELGRMEFIGYHNGKPTIIVRQEGDATIEAAVEAFRSFLLAFGYHPDNVTDVLGDPR